MMIPLLLAADEPAAHGVEHAEVMAISIVPAITALVVFLIAFGLLYILVWPKIVKGLDDRQEKIRQEIASAEAARQQANAALADYQKNLAAARDEANQMIARARQDAKAVAEDLRARNQEELTDMKQRATREIETAKQNAILELHSEATTLAFSIAGKILQREITDRDQQNLVDDSLRELAQAGKK